MSARRDAGLAEGSARARRRDEMSTSARGTIGGASGDIRGIGGDGQRSSSPAIVVNGLTKRFGDKVAVEALDFEVPTGSLAGFVGPNGAGKTTTLRMLVGLLRPSSGEGNVLGEPLTMAARYLPRVGALIEAPGFYAGLSGTRNLEVLAAAAGLDAEPIPDLLDRVGLADRGRDPYRTYSLGMKQRLSIAAALLGEPELLILDEPANGLDPQGMRDMRLLLRAVRDEGRTVLVSSHLLGELEQICDWLVVISEGRRLFQGTPGELVGIERLALRPEHDAHVEVLAELINELGFEAAIADGRVLVPFSDAPERRQEIATIVRRAAAAGMTLVEIASYAKHLEQAYLELIGGRH
jgi:ABC-2 type transport system ATP-binding protein